MTMPANAVGGTIALTNNVFGFGLRNVVCVNSLTGKQASALDRLLDDGVANTGNVRSDIIATTPIVGAPTVTTQYVEDTTGVMLCKTL